MDFILELHHLDQRFSLWINSFHSVHWDHFMQLMSDRNTWFPMYLLIAAILVYRLGWKRGLAMVAAIALSVACCDQLGNLVKWSVGRLRPCYSPFMLDGGLHMLEGRGSFFGFYSAHSANAFGFAAALRVALSIDGRLPRPSRRLWTGVAFVWALLVGGSRIFAGKHYFGDVLVGALVGVAIGTLLGLAAKWILARTAAPAGPAREAGVA